MSTTKAFDPVRSHVARAIGTSDGTPAASHSGSACDSLHDKADRPERQRAPDLQHRVASGTSRRDSTPGFACRRVRSQFWSQLPPFASVHLRLRDLPSRRRQPAATVANADLADLEAGWDHALTISNLVSSAMLITPATEAEWCR